jgi:hypothetical protein
VSAAPSLSGPSIPSGVRLLLLPRAGGDGPPAWRRRAAVAASLLLLAGVSGGIATGALGPRGAGATPAAPQRTTWSRDAGTGEAPDLAPPPRRASPSRLPDARPASGRVVAPAHAPALFAQRSWYVAPPPRPPPPPPPAPPPPEPTAPPLPFAFVGSLTPTGAQPVFFLARGDRVVDAHVGDRLDGVYQLESAAGGQLVFVYLPLNVRQTLAAGVPR